MRKPLWTITGLLLITLAGCGGDEPADPWAGAPAAPAAADLGPGGQADACETMPVRFSIPEKYEPDAVDAESAELSYGSGNLMPVCNLKLKRASHYGQAHLWTGPGTDPQTVLTDFMAEHHEKATEVAYRAITLSGVSGAEVRYLRPATDLSETATGRAFAVPAGGKMCVFTWNGFDESDQTEGMPMYELVKASIVAAP